MTVARSSRTVLAAASAGLALLSGCVVAPNGYYPAAYPATVYDGTAYYAPGYYCGSACYYYSSPYPYYWAPSMSIFGGYYGGWNGSYGWRGHSSPHPGGGWRPGGSRPNWGGGSGGMRPGMGAPSGGGSRSGMGAHGGGSHSRQR
jgi:hypothetical protein